MKRLSRATDVELMIAALVLLGLSVIAVIVKVSDLALIGFFIVTLWALVVGALGGIAGAWVVLHTTTRRRSDGPEARADTDGSRQHAVRGRARSTER